jgi:RNA polymerase sigma-70 factor (ECF subfamily)
VLEKAKQERGRFRCFILFCCSNFLKNRYRADQAEKRGGKTNVYGLDFAPAETQFAVGRPTDSDPEKLFLRDWAFALIESAFASLEADRRRRGRLDLFVRLKPHFYGEDDAKRYREIAAECKTSEDAVKKEAAVLKKLFEETIRSLIRETVATPEEVEQEIRDLFRAIR